MQPNNHHRYPSSSPSSQTPFLFTFYNATRVEAGCGNSAGILRELALLRNLEPIPGLMRVVGPWGIWIVLRLLDCILGPKRRCLGHWFVQYGALAAYYLPTPLLLYAARAVASLRSPTAIFWFSLHNIALLTLSSTFMFQGVVARSALGYETKAFADYMTLESRRSPAPFFDGEANNLDSNCKYHLMYTDDGHWVRIKDLLQCDRLPVRNCAMEARDIFLSYSLCRLLARRYYGFPCAEEGNAEQLAWPSPTLPLSLSDQWARVVILSSSLPRSLTDRPVPLVIPFLCSSPSRTLVGVRQPPHAASLDVRATPDQVLNPYKTRAHVALMLPPRLALFSTAPLATRRSRAASRAPPTPLPPIRRKPRPRKKTETIASFADPGRIQFADSRRPSAIGGASPRATHIAAAVIKLWPPLLLPSPGEHLPAIPSLSSFDSPTELRVTEPPWLVASRLHRLSFALDPVNEIPTSPACSCASNQSKRWSVATDPLDSGDVPAKRRRAPPSPFFSGNQCRHVNLDRPIGDRRPTIDPIGVNRTCDDDDLLKKSHEVATALSRYCAYLVAFHPELLPEHSLNTMTLLQQVLKEAKDLLGSTRSSMEKNDKIQGLQLLGDEGDSSLNTFQKGIKLGRRLADMLNSVRWKVMAEFWAETVLYVAPSDDVDSSAARIECLTKGGEFVTHIWAMLSNAGILKRATEEWSPRQSEPDSDISIQEQGLRLRRSNSLPTF
ncbi:hypothetical protein HU200_059376 [Digitaria exilis]|uniref:DUF4220 domain-containing protein n=1 Tax=Digitaria exilis TaxID=1010633 RepID=A0A835ACU1_9POAL|nr:hypothetical protein HU200_059376 [Digitaria exilis]